MTDERVISVEHLHKSYGSVVAVKDINFAVQRGEIFGIVGPNGAGKTTTLECLTGFRTPDGGRIEVMGFDPLVQARQLRMQIGIQQQASALPEDIKVWEALDLFASFYPNPANWHGLLETWGLSSKHNARFGSLSGGQKQRLFIALALINNPRLVFLDEISTGLDPQARRSTWEMIERLRQEDKTVVMVTHFMDEAEELCDRVAIIDGGSLVALDTPANLVKDLHAENRVSFGAKPAEDYTWLANLSGVSRVARHNGSVVVSGQGAILARVATALAERGILPADLKSEQSSLEDVFLALTGRKIRN